MTIVDGLTVVMEVTIVLAPTLLLVVRCAGSAPPSALAAVVAVFGLTSALLAAPEARDHAAAAHGDDARTAAHADADATAASAGGQHARHGTELGAVRATRSPI